MICCLTTSCRNSGLPLRGLALLVAVAMLGVASREARAGMVLPAELAAPSADATAAESDSLTPDSAEDESSDCDSEQQKATPSVADQQADAPSGASGAGSSLSSSGSTLAVIVSAGVSCGSLEPSGACLERANSALPMPPASDFLRPPCRLA